MQKIDPCLSGGSFKGGAICIGGLKVFLVLLFFFLTFSCLPLLYKHMPHTEENEENLEDVRTGVITEIILGVVEITFAVILIIAAIKSHTGLLMTWIVFTIICCCGAALGGLALAVCVPLYVVPRIVGVILGFEAIHIYFLLIVNSLRLDIKEKRQQQAVVYKAMIPDLEKCQKPS